ncbi:unnamed protein product [Acanthoscelides obtectus]|uniref:Uncharacterized protein n=1 Tax=Acanthoscelides obtectus TaxID=200917 RepID=A0A9P0JWG2_ACAOB|nr:unnamed protein product [Acanthoscelides obtectus]CAK1657154.1 hypothetical protein AOBTE_LOCUS20161 [Acanthoscelides obtectus]
MRESGFCRKLRMTTEEPFACSGTRISPIIRSLFLQNEIHAVVRGIPAMFSEQEIKGELEQREYTPLHIIRLKRSGGPPMPLVVVILPKIEKSQQLFNEH